MMRKGRADGEKRCRDRKSKKKFSWHRTPRSVVRKLRHSALSRKRWNGFKGQFALAASLGRKTIRRTI
jgi:hypothetical protein